MHRVDKINLWIVLREVLHGCNHTDEAVTEVFSSMASNQYQLLTTIETSHIIACCSKDFILLLCKSFVYLKLIDHHVKCIDDGVAGDVNATMSFLFKEVLLGE